MQIRRVHIQNFRCLENIEIEFDKITSFIGPNGAGKSTVLRALDWFFNGAKGSELTDEDCTFGSTSNEIIVEVEFNGLTPEDRKALGHYATEGIDKFVAWKYKKEDGSEIMTGNAKTFEPFLAIRNAANATEMKRIYNELTTHQPELGFQAASTKDAILEAMTTWELGHADQLADSELQTNFFGFNSQAKMAGLFDFVFVTADLRASEEAADGKATIIGRILERAINRQSADQEIAALTEEVKDKQQAIYDRNFQQQLDSISNDLTDAVAQYALGRKVKVQTKDLELQPPKTQFAVSVLDSEVETHIIRQGHGFQRTLLIAALQLLAQHKATAEAKGTICLAIEEPELFQHPVQAQAFAQVLRRLAEDTDQNLQVTYATHSPYFVEPQYFDEVRRVNRATQKNTARSPEVEVCMTSVTGIKSKLNGYLQGATVDNQIQGVCLNRLPEALFANGVVLVEGTTDRAVTEGAAERPGNASLALSGIVVADVGGKNNLFLAHAILTELGIPCYVVFDGDKEIATRMNSRGKKRQDIAQAESDSKKLNRKLLKYLGATEEDWPASNVSDSFTVIEDTLETWLKLNWPEWEQEKDHMVAAGLGSPDKNSLIYKHAARQAGANPPPLFSDILNKIHSLL